MLAVELFLKSVYRNRSAFFGQTHMIKQIWSHSLLLPKGRCPFGPPPGDRRVLPLLPLTAKCHCTIFFNTLNNWNRKWIYFCWISELKHLCKAPTRKEAQCLGQGQRLSNGLIWWVKKETGVEASFNWLRVFHNCLQNSWGAIFLLKLQKIITMAENLGHLQLGSQVLILGKEY